MRTNATNSQTPLIPATPYRSRTTAVAFAALLLASSAALQGAGASRGGFAQRPVGVAGGRSAGAAMRSASTGFNKPAAMNNARPAAVAGSNAAGSFTRNSIAGKTGSAARVDNFGQYQGKSGSNRMGGKTGSAARVDNFGHYKGNSSSNWAGKSGGRVDNFGKFKSSDFGAGRPTHFSGGLVRGPHTPEGFGSHARVDYLSKRVRIRDHEFIERTYHARGMTFARLYRPVVFRGIGLHIYTPSRFFRPAFYGWAYRPWFVPVRYRWGWFDAPWFACYRRYFTPYPVYASPATWLTDYVVGSTLQQGYMEAAAAGAPPVVTSQAPLTPEVKQAIAEEVQRQIALENAERQTGTATGVPGMLADNTSHVFLVPNSLSVMSREGACSLTQGDVLQLAGSQSNGTAADLMVLAGKDGDCGRGSIVTVALQDLQEMQNQMRATIDQGLVDLQARQGQDGLPAAPADFAGAAQ